MVADNHGRGVVERLGVQGVLEACSESVDVFVPSPEHLVANGAQWVTHHAPPGPVIAGHKRFGQHLDGPVSGVVQGRFDELSERVHTDRAGRDGSVESGHYAGGENLIDSILEQLEYLEVGADGRGWPNVGDGSVLFAGGERARTAGQALRGVVALRDGLSPHGGGERLHRIQLVRVQFGVVAGQHLLMHVEEQLTMAVVEDQDQPQLAPVQRPLRVEECIDESIAPGVVERVGEEPGDFLVGRVGHVCGPVTAWTDHVEQRYLVVITDLLHPGGEGQWRAPDKRIHLMPMLMMFIGQQVFAPVVELRRQPPEGQRCADALRRQRGEQPGRGTRSTRLGQLAATLIVCDKERHALANQFWVGAGTLLVDDVEGRLQPRGLVALRR